MQKAIIITAPSGAGKTTITNHLLKEIDILSYSVSATTRSIRPEEKEGVDYYFMNVEAFKKKVKNDAFVEWEEVYDDLFYGTLKSELERIWALDKVVVFVVDVVGALALEKYFGQKAMSLFIHPPSIEKLRARLEKRGTESKAKLEQRLAKVDEEIKYANRFDHIIINDLLEVAFVEAELLVENYIAKVEL